MNAILDFDAFMAEKKEEFIEVVVFGKAYKVKRSVPALFVVEAARAGLKNDAAAIGLQTLRMGDVMFGKDAITEMCEKGMSAEQLSMLISKTFSMVSDKDVDNEDISEGEYDDESGYMPAAQKSPKK